MRERALYRCMLKTLCFDRVNQNHYYARPMADRVAIDSVAFARNASELRAAVPVADMPHLRDVLYDQSGHVSYTLAGAVNKDGIASLQLAISAGLMLTCQRCLGPVPLQLQSLRSFELVPQGEDLGDPSEEPDEMERIHADPALDVGTLIEDEVILCLPMIARHEPGKCSPPVIAGAEDESKLPFSSLAVLRRH